MNLSLEKCSVTHVVLLCRFLLMLRPGVSDMSLERMICDSCGAPLDVPESAKFVTCRHCQTHLRVRRDESVHYTEQLEQIEQHTRKISERLDQVEAYQELEALDREWMIERENFMIKTKHGHRETPQVSHIIVGVIATLFGIFWTVFTAVAFPPFALFGIVFIAIAIFNTVSGFTKLQKYQNGEARYRQRRQELVGSNEESAYE